MEVTNVTAWVSVGEFSVETDVVGVAIHPTVVRRERQVNALVRCESCGRWSRRCLVGLCSIGLVKDGHVEHVITSQHTVGCLEVPVVRQTSIDWEDTSVDAIIQARKCAWLTECDVNRFNVEDHLLDVVGVAHFIVAKPWYTSSGVVEDGLCTNHVDAGEELVVGNGGCCNVFCIHIGSRDGVGSILVEGEFLQCDVVESNTLEAVVDTVASVTVALELEVDINGRACE